MSTNIIQLTKVLNDLEYQEIDDFCNAHQGIENLLEIAEFLQEKFSLTLVLDQEIVAGFASDSSNLPARAEALCRPNSEHQTAIILRAGRAAKIPMTLSGGRSNLTGSATAEGGIVISTAKLDETEIVVDREKLQVTSPVNIILEELREKILEDTRKALYYPVDPTSRGDAWVGGTIACNASGFTPGEIGATRDWVVGLDVILPDGLKIKAVRGQYISENGEFILEDKKQQRGWPVPTYPQPQIKNASGPFSSPDGKIDLIDMFIGSEGLFGLVTGCILKLAPRPKEYLDLFFSLLDEDRAIAFYQFLDQELAGNFGTLSAFEYFGVNSQSYMDHRERLFYGDNQVAIYLQIPIGEKSLDQEIEIWFNRLLASNCDIDPEAVILFDNEPKRRIFMESRHSMPANALEVIQKHGTYTIMTDTVVPPERFAEFLDYIHALLKTEGIDYLSFGHFGDCHLHFTLLPEQEKLKRAAELYDLFIVKAVELGGVYSGEHGTGKRKRKDFITLYNQAAIEQLKACKAAVDPDFLINRGNVFIP